MIYWHCGKLRSMKWSIDSWTGFVLGNEESHMKQSGFRFLIEGLCLRMYLNIIKIICRGGQQSVLEAFTERKA